MSRWTAHKARWSGCTRCELSARRSKVVLLRGKLPAPILFLGEAPGLSEDVIGRPFVGPAGNLLDQIIEVAVDGRYDYALTNLIACIPYGEDGAKVDEPPKWAIKECAPRLLEVISICNPRLIIAVGKLAEKWVNFLPLESENRAGSILNSSITHPAAILRANVAAQPLMVKRCIAVIEGAVARLET